MNNSKLIVRTFGEFSLEWNGAIFVDSTRHADTQLVRLIQILLHYRHQGVDRNQLMDVLDDNSNSDDVHHLFRTVLYNLRKKLKASCLPESRYIEFYDGKYYWTDEIPVLEDAEEFEGLCRRIERENDARKKAELCLKACYMYKGDFLPNQTRMTWVSEEEQRYYRLFKYCTEIAAGYLRDKGDYERLEALGYHASAASPFHEWEVLTMEALISQGKIRESQELYERTTELYDKGLGLRPIPEMMNKISAFSSRVGFKTSGIDIIREGLSESEPENGAFSCPYYVFQGIFRAISRASARCGFNAHLMICTIVSNAVSEDAIETSPDEVAVLKLSDRVNRLICSNLRGSDIICRYSMVQFLIIVMNEDIKDCYAVRDGIDKSLKNEMCNVKLEYDISRIKPASVISTYA